MSFDDIKKNIDENPNLEGVESVLTHLIDVMLQQFPNMNVALLKNRISSLEIKKCLELQQKVPALYNTGNNKILLNESMMEQEDIDMEHQMYQCLLSCATQKDSIDNSMQAIHAGFAEMSANQAVGNKGDYSSNLEEFCIVNTLISVVGYHAVEHAFLSDSLNPILQQIAMNGLDGTAFRQLIEKANYNYKARQTTGKSIYPELVTLASKFMTTPEQIEVASDFFLVTDAMDMESVMSAKKSLLIAQQQIVPYQIDPSAKVL